MEELNLQGAAQPEAAEAEVNTEAQPAAAESIATKEVSQKKFKSGEELENAYNSLEKEFTKRSQRLRALERELAQAKTSETPVYAADGWHQTVDKFLADYPEAVPFKGEIARTVMEGNLQNNPHCLELALSKVLVNNYRAPAKLIEDDSFLEDYVFTNQKIQSRILSDYLKRVAEIRVPKTISGGGQAAVTPPVKPKSFREAGELWTKNFK